MEKILFRTTLKQYLIWGDMHLESGHHGFTICDDSFFLQFLFDYGFKKGFLTEQEYQNKELND
jgi:hypothetical protein